jgi:hypothetical protein
MEDAIGGHFRNGLLMTDASTVRKNVVKIGEKRRDGAQERKYARQREAGWDSAITPVTILRANASPTGKLKKEISRVQAARLGSNHRSRGQR